MVRGGALAAQFSGRREAAIGYRQGENYCFLRTESCRVVICSISSVQVGAE